MSSRMLDVGLSSSEEDLLSRELQPKVTVGERKIEKSAHGEATTQGGATCRSGHRTQQAAAGTTGI